MRRLSDIICNRDPLVLSPSTSVQEACCQMRDRRVGSTLIEDTTGRLLGIFTGRDVIRRVVAPGKNAAHTALSEVMTSGPTTMSVHDTAIDALRLMWDGGFRHVPVVEAGKVVGVVSRGDFLAGEQNRLEEERELWEHMR